MKLPSFIKRKRRTLNPGFRNYKTLSRVSKRKPIKIKKRAIKSPSTRLTKRSAQKKMRFFLILKGTIVLAVVAVISYGLFLTPFFEIQKIQIRGNAETLDEEAALNTYLQAYLGDNIILFPTIKHENSLLSEFPYLQTLNISRKLPNTLQVVLEPNPQVANIKIDQVNTEISYYIVNNLGFISSIGVSDETLPTIVMDVTGIDVEIDNNAEIINAETLEILIEVGKDFEGKFKMNVLETIYLKRAREIHIYTERDFYVWIDLTQDVNQQLNKLKKAMTKLNLYEANLEYIDLRISGQNGEKIIYKLKDEEK